VRQSAKIRQRAYAGSASRAAHWEEGPKHDRCRIDRGVTRDAIRGDCHALESDGRSSPPQSTKGRAFHHEIRPNRRNRCALLITSRINAPIQGDAGLVNERGGRDVVVSRVPFPKTRPLRSRPWMADAAHYRRRATTMTNISKTGASPDEKEAPSHQTVEHSSNALVVATRRRSGRRKGLVDLRSVIARVTKAKIGCPAPQEEPVLRRSETAQALQSLVPPI
jgi:hypothetical protein